MRRVLVETGWAPWFAQVFHTQEWELDDLTENEVAARIEHIKRLQTRGS